MATQVQWRRGTTAQVAVFTGAVGEVVVDTTTWQMSVQDGVTAGGHYTGLATGGTFNNIIITGASNVLTGTFTGGTWVNLTLTTPTINTPAISSGTWANPTFTGSVIAPTPSLSANNFLVPTTSWVRSVIQLSSPLNIPIAATMPLLYG